MRMSAAFHDFRLGVRPVEGKACVQMQGKLGIKIVFGSGFVEVYDGGGEIS